MRIVILLAIFILSSSFITAQEKVESDIEFALQYAKKGIYYALSNIPEKKSKLERDLIADDRLYAHVRLDKEVNGVKIESTGYYQTHEVRITIYRSNDSLEKNGYLKSKQ
jgi:hypothetical protein